MTTSPPDRPARILIVDDEPLNVDYLEQELEAHGFRTATAGNGLEALERVAADPPDLVLLDVMMPAMDGISALRILKGDPETRLIPVVLMTALNAVEDRVRGIEAGADDFLSKPVDDRELLARIRTALSLKRTIDETVGELRSTSAYLERYGRRERDVTVLAVEWRLRDRSLPREAAGFLCRGRRAAAEERIRALGGIPSEGDASMLVAVFEGPDPASRAGGWGTGGGGSPRAAGAPRWPPPGGGAWRTATLAVRRTRSRSGPGSAPARLRWVRSACAGPMSSAGRTAPRASRLNAPEASRRQRRTPSCSLPRTWPLQWAIASG